MVVLTTTALDFILDSPSKIVAGYVLMVVLILTGWTYSFPCCTHVSHVTEVLTHVANLTYITQILSVAPMPCM